MLYLELGVIPIRFIVMSRRLMFQHYLLNEEDSSLVNNFYKLQSRKSVKNDWSLTVKQNLETLEIALSEEHIKNMSEPAYKTIVNSAIKRKH